MTGDPGVTPAFDPSEMSNAEIADWALAQANLAEEMGDSSLAGLAIILHDFAMDLEGDQGDAAPQ